MIFSLKDYKQIALKSFIVTVLSALSLSLYAKKSPAFSADIEPKCWWVNMEMDTLELLLRVSIPGQYSIEWQAEHSKILSTEKAKNPSYYYVTVVIAGNQKAEETRFVIRNSSRKIISTVPWSLLERTDYRPQGIHQGDNMYLLFPDRFANGDTTNDDHPKMNEPKADRSGLKLRHGGDLKGISDHVDYLEQLGVTALWINPVLENDQKKESYHGYAATESYLIDRRFGTNNDFCALSDQCHKAGIKMVWDVVYNHWGLQHKLFIAPPDSNWFNWSSEFMRTSYRAETLMDPYASEADKNEMLNGWFDHHMPDLNQKDPHLALYLIQNSIWWIEFAHLDAFRIDTYSYPDQRFMSDLNQALKREYPQLLIFGETWVQGSPIQAWYTQNNNLNKAFNSHLDGVTDFQMYFAFTKAFNEDFGWEEGLRRIELTLSHDLLYDNPTKNVTFLDNHDLSRWYSVIHEDFSKWKISNAMLFTLRGIPCIYYGHEILMKNFANPDALVREDFPGGWPSDTINKFDIQNLSSLEKEAFLFTQNLMQWRKSNTWLKDASLKQFVPQDNTYIYFRSDSDHAVMCVYNLNKESKTIALNRFQECIQDYTKGIDVLTQQSLVIDKEITIDANSAFVIQLSK